MDETQQRLSRILKPLGFHKKGPVWLYPVPYGFLVIEIQRSWYGASSEINLGMWIEGVDTTRREGIVRWLDCGIQGRLERVGMAAADVVAWVCSNACPEHQEMARKEMGRVLKELVDADALRNTYGSGKLTQFLTTPEARQWLGDEE